MARRWGLVFLFITLVIELVGDYSLAIHFHWVHNPIYDTWTPSAISSLELLAISKLYFGIGLANCLHSNTKRVSYHLIVVSKCPYYCISVIINTMVWTSQTIPDRLIGNQIEDCGGTTFPCFTKH